MRKYRAMALPAVALGVLLLAGCGLNTTNEENIDRTKAPGGTGGAGVQNYGDFARKQAEKVAQAQKEAKEAKAKGKGKPAPAEQPKPEEPEKKSP
jgi:hypothetical protein